MVKKLKNSVIGRFALFRPVFGLRDSDGPLGWVTDPVTLPGDDVVVVLRRDCWGEDTSEWVNSFHHQCRAVAGRPDCAGSDRHSTLSPLQDFDYVVERINGSVYDVINSISKIRLLENLTTSSGTISALRSARARVFSPHRPDEGVVSTYRDFWHNGTEFVVIHEELKFLSAIESIVHLSNIDR